MILVVQRKLPHYRLAAFRALSDALDGGLTIAHGDPLAGPPGPGFRQYPLPLRPLLGGRMMMQPVPLARFGSPAAVVVEHNIRILSHFSLVRSCRALGIPVLLWGHGGSRRRSLATSSDLRDRCHRWLLRQADGYIAYTHAVAAEVAQVIGPDRTHVAQNTIDIGPIADARRVLEARGRAAVRAELGLPRRHYLLFLGRLLAEKRPGAVIDVLAACQAAGEDMGAVFIGDGPERAALEARARDLPEGSVRFTGAMTDNEASAPYIFACDALLMPDHLGLAANHAMVLGVPVLTRAPGPGDPPHGPEIDYVRADQTGFVLQDRSVAAMRDAVSRTIAAGEDLRRTAARFAEDQLMLDQWVAGFRRAVQTVAQDSNRL